MTNLVQEAQLQRAASNHVRSGLEDILKKVNAQMDHLPPYRGDAATYRFEITFDDAPFITGPGGLGQGIRIPYIS